MQRHKLMREVEARENRGNIEDWLPVMAQELGLAETGRRLGVSRSTVKSWVLEMGFRLERRMVPVGPRGDADSPEGAGRD